ncbi:Bifunctional homocysteine S-methyltransferase/5,10-methylenetetrahydrofolate reductase [Sporomusa carbonis]|uniref:methylenetetrahydrofolate reductase n=1 Tax=Sporomusa carbonis TaxID=3076075 RepID=UPI003A761E75
MRFKEDIQSGKFVVTAEVGPPKGTDLSEMIHRLEGLKGKVTALNVTDNQSAVMRVCTLAVAKIITDMGIEPIYQMTCRDRNRVGLQSDLLGASALGIKNVLAMTGDHPVLGDHKNAKPVFDIESVQLLEIINGLNAGHDMAGLELKGKTEFFAGAVVAPEANPFEPQFAKFEKKIKAGAKFFQTQAVFDMAKFMKFMERAKEYNVPIMAGILLLKSAGMARYLNQFVAGVSVPQELIDELASADKPLQKGIEIAGRQIAELKEVCAGVHVMAIGVEDKVPEILAAAGL